MSWLQIDVPFDAPLVSFESTLESSVFRFDMDWNERAGLWFVSIYSPRAAGAAVPILLGQACVAQRPLLQGVVNDLRPLGELIIVGRDPGRYDWQTYSRLLYAESAELST